MSRTLEERADLLTVLLAREITDESVVVMGTGTPLTAVAILTAMLHHAPKASYTSPLGGGLSVRPHPLALQALERNAHTNAVLRSAQIIDLWELATINPRVRERWLQFFRPAQIDETGNMNNSVIKTKDGRTLRLPGSVGISDMAAYYARVFSYVTRHRREVFRRRVDFVSAPGTLGTNEQRIARGLRWGRPFRVLTDLCVLEFDDDGRMMVVSVHPSVSIDEIQDATEFRVRVAADVATTEPPSRTELAALAEADPDSLRRLEMVSNQERRRLIREIVG